MFAMFSILLGVYIYLSIVSFLVHVFYKIYHLHFLIHVNMILYRELLFNILSSLQHFTIFETN